VATASKRALPICGQTSDWRFECSGDVKWRIHPCHVTEELKNHRQSIIPSCSSYALSLSLIPDWEGKSPAQSIPGSPRGVIDQLQTDACDELPGIGSWGVVALCWAGEVGWHRAQTLPPREGGRKGSPAAILQVKGWSLTMRNHGNPFQCNIWNHMMSHLPHEHAPFHLNSGHTDQVVFRLLD